MKSEQLAAAIAWEERLGAANAEASANGIPAVRAANAQFMAERAGTLPDDLQVEPVDAGGVPGEWVSRGADSGAVLLFLHSGGCVVGSAAENREWVGRLAQAAAARVLAIDFRLAPEHPWPAQPEDAVTAYRWLLAQGTDPGAIALVGESGGGGVLLATLVALRDAGDPLPGAAVLTSPLVDMALTAESLDANAATDPFVSRPALEGMMMALLQGQDAAAASPLNADLAGLPPLLVQVGTAEAIYDDGRRLAEKAEAAGVQVTFEPWEDMIHLWHGFPDLPEAQRATERIGAFIAERVKARA
jgi:monoterpene epsilon-lactone hydrolase